MRSLLLALLFSAAPAGAVKLQAGSVRDGVADSAISPSTITATGTGYSIQATNGNVYANGMRIESGTGGILDLATDGTGSLLHEANSGQLTYKAFRHVYHNHVGMEFFRVNDGGNLGLGTASPATKLHLSSGTFTQDGTFTDAGIKLTNPGNGTLTNITQNTANGAVLVSGTNADLMYRPLIMGSFSNSNPTKPQAGLWWQNDNNFGTKLFLGTSNNFATGITNSGFAMDQEGRVGIGTASPATSLDVNGSAQFGSGADKSTFTATGFWEPISKTRAQVNTLVPTKIGQVIYVSDTTLPGLCVSTGTLAAQWRKMESATLGCGTNN